MSDDLTAAPSDKLGPVTVRVTVDHVGHASPHRVGTYCKHCDTCMECHVDEPCPAGDHVGVKHVCPHRWERDKIEEEYLTAKVRKLAPTVPILGGVVARLEVEDAVEGQYCPYCGARRLWDEESGIAVTIEGRRATITGRGAEE